MAHALPAERVIELRRPADLGGGGKLRELRLREPTALDVWTAEQCLGEVGNAESSRLYSRKLVSRVTGVAEDTLDLVPVSELVAATDFLQGFIMAGLEPQEARQDEWEFELSPPIAHGGGEFGSLHLREPAFGEVRKAEGHLRAGLRPQAIRSYQMWLVTHVSGAPFQVIQKMPVSRLNEAAVYLQGFTLPGQRTGAT